MLKMSTLICTCIQLQSRYVTPARGNRRHLEYDGYEEAMAPQRSLQQAPPIQPPPLKRIMLSASDELQPSSQDQRIRNKVLELGTWVQLK
ncbi:hypothetical protein AMELA_G00160360 [Ameiurus melas]|uniref:Uncharacterized protein n=1 Tax=Ameiurus melas TaxID=219545 RepID=A0A7J6AFE6_AMEME|nr:hypothetical protein AMELA_G00160360 [Ameiurus melas]